MYRLFVAATLPNLGITQNDSWGTVLCYQALDGKHRKYGKGHPFSMLHLTDPYPYDMHNRLHMITYILY